MIHAVPLTRPLDAETMRIIRVARIRREYRDIAAALPQLEAAYAKAATPGMREARRRQLHAAQARLSALREEWAANT